jgi:hypothetical protein
VARTGRSRTGRSSAAGHRPPPSRQDRGREHASRAPRGGTRRPEPRRDRGRRRRAHVRPGEGSDSSSTASGTPGDRGDGPTRREVEPLSASTSRLPDSPGAEPEPAP